MTLRSTARARSAPGRARAVAIAVALTVAAAVVASGVPAPAAADTPRWQRLSPPPTMPAPAAEGVVTIGDARLRWARHGAADAPPLVLLHGGMGSGDDFAAQLPALAAHFRVIVVDSRGHGRSTRGQGGLGYHAMAEDLVAVLDHLGLARVAVLGWSDGGIVALDLAIHHPTRVDRLVVTGVNTDKAGTRSTAGSATFKAYFARAVKEYRRLAPDPRQLAAFRKDLRAMWKRQPAYTEAQLRTIVAPLLVLHGEHDELVRRDHAERLAAVVARGTFVELPGVSHFAMWQDPDAFDRAALAFLTAP